MQVLVTAVSATSSTNMDGVPMTVDFRLKSAARAKIPRNWLRRDLAPNDYETLTSRMIDRSLRGAFPSGYCNETQVLG